MWPILLEFTSFGLIIPAWHAFVCLGGCVGFLLFDYNVKNFYPKLYRFVPPILTFSYVAGLLGARLLSIFVEELSLVDSLWDIVKKTFTFGPMTLYGGLLAGLSSFVVACRFFGIASLKLLDCAAGPFFFGLALGRVGCFLNGDDYGIRLDSDDWLYPIGFEIPSLGDQVVRFPAQLLQGTSSLCIAVFCQLKSSKNLPHRPVQVGKIFFTSLLAYSILRFNSEYFRGDERGDFWGFSTSQWISLVIFVISLYLLRQKKTNLADG